MKRSTFIAGVLASLCFAGSLLRRMLLCHWLKNNGFTIDYSIKPRVLIYYTDNWRAFNIFGRNPNMVEIAFQKLAQKNFVLAWRETEGGDPATIHLKRPFWI